MTSIKQYKLTLSAALLTFMLAAMPAKAQNPYVCLDTSLGNICLELFADTAPASVENFLTYMNNGDYNRSIFHRNVSNFVLQTGGYNYRPSTGLTEIPALDPVQNEYSRSNLRGTIAMAKLGGDPNSATNEWFVNLADNSENLDNQNGGFTVFGQVVGDGMTVVDEIVAGGVFDLRQFFGNAFGALPIRHSDGCLSGTDFYNVYRVYETTAENLPGRYDDVTVLPTTLGEFNGSCFSIPLEYRGKLYQVIFDRIANSTGSDLLFRVRQSQIVLLTDTGQDRAIFDGDNRTVTIPAILYGFNQIKNIVMELTDLVTLEFKLSSYERP